MHFSRFLLAVLTGKVVLAYHFYPFLFHLNRKIMATGDQHTAHVQPAPLLVVEFHLGHRLIIEHTIQTTMPQIKPVFKSTAEEALDYLFKITDRKSLFPKLVLMDICLSAPETGWQLLQTLRLRYPTLPVIILSREQDAETILKAYERGAHSFVEKPAELAEWKPVFISLRDYWLGTVTLPPLK